MHLISNHFYTGYVCNRMGRLNCIQACHLSVSDQTCLGHLSVSDQPALTICLSVTKPALTIYGSVTKPALTICRSVNQA